MKNYKCIIYDFDGVICDSVNIKTEAFVSLYKSFGLEVEEKVKSYHLLNGGISRYEKFKYFSKYLLNKDISENELVELGDTFSNIVLNKIIEKPTNSGVIEFLEANTKTSIQFICSGTPNEEMNKIIKEKKLDKYFKDVFGSPLSKEIIINNIINKYKLNPNEVLFFGDAMTDYNAAKDTLIDFIGIENPDTVFPIGTTVIKSFKQLLKNE